MLSFVDSAGSVFLANLTQIENTNAQTQAQISSGLKVSQPSDAPDQVSQLLDLQANLSANTQIQTNLTNVQSSATAADSALTTTLQLADQASSLGAQGASSTTSATTRGQLAQQVQSIFSEVLSLSQTSQGGRYIFGGDADTSPSYQADSTQPNGVDRLSTALNTSQVEDTNGNLISVGLTAGQIFDHRNSDDSLASDNLFAALTSLSTALTNNDTAGINAGIGAVQQASQYVNTQQGFYAALENRLTSGLNAAQTGNVALTGQISGIRDTNISAAAIQLTQGTTEYQAALEARSKVPTSTLFNYLA